MKNNKGICKFLQRHDVNSFVVSHMKVIFAINLLNGLAYRPHYISTRDIMKVMKVDRHKITTAWN